MSENKTFNKTTVQSLLIICISIFLSSNAFAQNYLNLSKSTQNVSNRLLQNGIDCSDVGIVPFSSGVVPKQGGVVQFFHTPRQCEFDYEPGTGIANNYSQRNNYLVEIEVDENNTGSTRNGNLLFDSGAVAFSVTQRADACTYTLSETSVTILGTQTSGSFQMNTQSGCEWQAYSLFDKININGTADFTVVEGTGSTTINYMIDDDFNNPRDFEIIIAGQKYSIEQVQAVCDLKIPINTLFVPVEGGTYTIDIQMNEECDYNYYQTLPTQEWVQVADNADSVGIVELTFEVEPNANNTARQADFVFASVNDTNFQNIPVKQDGQTEPARVKFDFGEGFSEEQVAPDLVVFRPNERNWYIDHPTYRTIVLNFGTQTDKPVPADYNGDGLTDIALFRPESGVWYVQYAQNFRSDYTGNADRIIQFGLNGDIPVPGDFDGDYKADFAIYRPSEGNWYFLKSSDGSYGVVRFGLAEDKPVVGDYDGDGTDDISLYRPSNGIWYRLNSSDGSFSSNQLGVATDIPVPADYDGDNKTDLAVYRASEGNWYQILSSDPSFTTVTPFGLPEDLPIPADYDSDRKADIAVFRPSDGNWYKLQSTDGFEADHYGTSGDIPAQYALIGNNY